jgi:DNA-binding protein YbaB
VEQAEGLIVDSAYDDLLSQAQDFGRSANPEAALRRMQDSMRALTERIEAVRSAEFSGADGSGTVTATVTGEGTLRRMDISAKAIRDLPAEALGPACLAAIQAARMQMAEGFQQQLAETLGRPLEPPESLPPVGEAIRQGMAEGARRWS